MQIEIFTADVVYNGLGTPQANAGVLIQGSGYGAAQIMNITSLSALAAIAEDIEMDFPIKDKGFAISPAPANPRIDLTAIKKDEIKVVLEKLDAIGISVVGIVSDDIDTIRFLFEQSLSGVIYWQPQVSSFLGLASENAFDNIVDQLRAFKSLEKGSLKIGLSFSSIYSVNEALLVKLAQLCEQNKVPLQIVVSQSKAEQDLYVKGEGDLLEQVLEHQPDWKSPMLSPVQYLNKIGVLEAEPTLVYMRYADEEDIRTLQYAGCTVIYCPRDEMTSQSDLSRLAVRFPWEIYMKHGVDVAFATGVQALQIGDVDIRQDVQTALKLQQEKMSPLAAVRSAVKGGYKALKMKPPIINKGDGVHKLYIW